MEQMSINQCRLCALITIVDYSLRNELSDLFMHHGLPVSLLTHGYGAADSEIYDILGFGEHKKAVVISILSESLSYHVYEVLHREMDFNKPGTGIAFTIPITGISHVLSRLCHSDDLNGKNESEGMPIMNNESYDLILTIVNSGYFNEVMDIARAAGATGGTLVHAKGLGTEEAAKFLGIMIQPEKDLVLILARHDIKHRIMESITKEAGLSSAGKGICFSLPVNAALGLGTHAI